MRDCNNNHGHLSDNRSTCHNHASGDYHTSRDYTTSYSGVERTFPKAPEP
jgi:hypothetical protein